MKLNYIVQTKTATYLELFSKALNESEYTHLDVAVAYATNSGVHTLIRYLETKLGAKFLDVSKRFLIGIDWCRSDPAALERLAALPKSDVRVPGGKALVAVKDCIPKVTYHPKLFIFRSGTSGAVICGSGNLSGNGLLKGCECGSVFIADRDDLINPKSEIRGLCSWFDDVWGEADKYNASIAKLYRIRCTKVAKKKVVAPTEDDVAVPVSVGTIRRGLSELQVKQLRTFDNFWIGAGALGANLGPGIPGNQLDMTRYTRVFFGAAAIEVPPNTELDHLTLHWGAESWNDRTLRFGNNGMDKLNVPPVGIRGDKFYAGKYLKFSRRKDGGYDFAVGDAKAKDKWKKQSAKAGAAYAMPGGREWGLF